jgi:hypothetical protein
LLGGFKAADISFHYLFKSLYVVNITTLCLHINGNAREVFAYQVKYNLIELRPMVTGIPFGNMNGGWCFFVRVGLAIVMKDG